MAFETFERSWGARFISDKTVRFRLWAEAQPTVLLNVGGRELPMDNVGDGWHQLDVDNLSHGCEYHYRLADGTQVPDPASLAQKEDVSGPSLVIDTRRLFADRPQWAGIAWEKSVVYELHIGTFTAEGTFAAAAEKLPYLAELGITQLEIMPVSQFGGRRGWGYDGVLLYALQSTYGTPDDFEAFIQAAHELGMAVVLDIVLNHFGPEGNYLPQLSPGFFDAERKTPWGNAIAYDKAPVREYISEAPLWWLTAYQLDGLRFDAIDQINDPSEKHILIEIAERIREVIPDRPVHLSTEDNRNVVFLHPRDAAGNTPLFTAEWNDDYHNAVHVFATGETHAYYEDFAERPAEKLATALTEGFVYQGEVSAFSGEARGVDSRGQPPQFFINFIQNHDQTGNRAQGERLISLAGKDKTQIMLAALLLSPHIPLLFMGEEYGETHPFLFFTDFHGELARAVREGRAEEFAGHAGHDEDVPDPNAVSTFTRSKLDWSKVTSDEGKAWLTLTRRLLELRQRHIVPLLETRRGGEGKVIGTGSGTVAVQWQFGNAILSLALNISNAQTPLPELPGKTLFSWPEADAGTTPYRILVRLADGEAS